MRGSREVSAFVALLFIYVLQTSVVTRLNLPLGGPNFIFVFFLAWVLRHDAMSGALIGFIVGLLMDFAPPSVSTAGVWTVVLTAVGYGVGALAARSQDIGNSPVVAWLFFAVGLFALFVGRLAIGSAIGETQPIISSLAKTLLGLLAWNLIFAPLGLWLSGRLYLALSPQAKARR